MDRLLYNASFYASTGRELPMDALGIENGKIVFMGRKVDAPQCAQIHDLHGAHVYPGFGDSHMHLLHFAMLANEIKLGSARSMEELMCIARTHIQKVGIPADGILRAHGWNQDLLAEKRMPTRTELDAITCAYPLIAWRICGHVAVVNTCALVHFGLYENFPQVEGGTFDIASGTFTENALGLLQGTPRKVETKEILPLLRRATQYAASVGLTSVHSDDFASMTGCDAETVIAAYKELAQSGELFVRVMQQCLLSDADAVRDFFANGHCGGEGEDTFSLHSIKILSDGSLGARTAFLRAPYADDLTTQGVPLYTQKQLDEMVELSHMHDMPVAIHAIGDAAITMALDAIARAQGLHPTHNPHHGIVHCQITDLSLLERIAQLHVQAYVQPIFLEYDAKIVTARVGTQLARTSYNWKTLIDHGVLVSGGSDCPVEPMDVLPNLYCAMTRKDIYGLPDGGFEPAQNLSCAQALTVFTQNVARASGNADRRGELAQGYDADLTILDQDILCTPPDAVKDICVVMTLMNGKITFSKIE